MQAEAATNKGVNVDNLMLLFAYYQLRNNFQDIVSETGVHGDLDEGSLILPIIHALNYQREQGSTELQSIFQARKLSGRMSLDMKEFVVKRLEEIGSLEYRINWSTPPPRRIPSFSPCPQGVNF
jgi:geranylgeranyl pyrophosphate synthase